jgi:hypothetical protein
MNQALPLDAVVTTSTPERKGEPRLWLVCFLIIAVGIVTIAALTLDGSLSSDQRVEVFQHSGMYP